MSDERLKMYWVKGTVMESHRPWDIEAIEMAYNAKDALSQVESWALSMADYRGDFYTIRKPEIKALWAECPYENAVPYRVLFAKDGNDILSHMGTLPERFKEMIERKALKDEKAKDSENANVEV